MTKAELVASVASTISDYREGEIEKPTEAHVDRWLSQFPNDVGVPLLRELDHVLKRTYFSRQGVKKFLTNLVSENKLAGKDPCGYWSTVNFLRIQKQGHSQQEMLGVFAEVLKKNCKLDIKNCGSKDGPFVYIDDAIFSGSRVGNDLESWIADSAPATANIHVVSMALHTLGDFLVKKRLNQVAAAKGKKVNVSLWHAILVENRLYYKDQSDVLWPVELPDDKAVKAYVALDQKFPFKPRTVLKDHKHRFFSSEEGRQLLEREFLLSGTRIRGFAASPSPIIKPLGFGAFGLGFGSLIASFRNCPNNCPLALWWGDPKGGAPLNKWYPLLPRKTYAKGVDFDDVF